MNTIDKIIESLKDRINNCTTTREDVGRKSAWTDALVMIREIKSSLEQEEKEQRVTAEEILKKHIGGEFQFKTFTSILTKECLDDILKAMHQFRDQGREVPSDEIQLLRNIKHWINNEDYIKAALLINANIDEYLSKLGIK